MRVLVVNDDPAVILLLTKMVKEWGHDVVACASAEEAWQALHWPEAPRIVIIDVMLPGTSGLELCRMIRRDPAAGATYIVMLTALNVKSNRLEGFDAGVDDYICKPFVADELRARLGVGIRIVEVERSLARRIAELEELVRRGAVSAPYASSDSKTDALCGALQTMPLSALTQSMHYSADTGVLQLDNTECGSGLVYFRVGEVRQAQAQALRGEDAFFEMLRWRSGRFSFRHGVVAPAPDIVRSAMGLLMEGLRRIDEAGRAMECEHSHAE